MIKTRKKKLHFASKERKGEQRKGSESKKLVITVIKLKNIKEVKRNLLHFIGKTCLLRIHQKHNFVWKGALKLLEALLEWILSGTLFKHGTLSLIIHDPHNFFSGTLFQHKVNSLITCLLTPGSYSPVGILFLNCL